MSRNAEALAKLRAITSAPREICQPTRFPGAGADDVDLAPVLLRHVLGDPADPGDRAVLIANGKARLTQPSKGAVGGPNDPVFEMRDIPDAGAGKRTLDLAAVVGMDALHPVGKPGRLFAWRAPYPLEGGAAIGDGVRREIRDPNQVARQSNFRRIIGASAARSRAR